MGEIFGRMLNDGAGPDLMAGLGWTWNAAKSLPMYAMQKMAEQIHPDRAHHPVEWSWDEFLTTGNAPVLADTRQPVNGVMPWMRAQDRHIDATIMNHDWGRVDIPFTEQTLRFNPVQWGLNAVDEFSNPVNLAGTLHPVGGDIADIATVVRGRMAQQAMSRAAAQGPSAATVAARRILDQVDSAPKAGYVQQLFGNSVEEYFKPGQIFNRAPAHTLDDLHRMAAEPLLPVPRASAANDFDGYAALESRMADAYAAPPRPLTYDDPYAQPSAPRGRQPDFDAYEGLLPVQRRLPHEPWPGGKRPAGLQLPDAGALYDEAMAQRSNDLMWSDWGKISDENAAMLQEASRGEFIPVGQRRIIDSSHARHIDLEHGADAAREVARGQIPVTRGDFLQTIPETFGAPDEIRYIPPRRGQGARFEHIKNIEESTSRYVEEVRPKHNVLSAVTFRRELPKENLAGPNPVPHTSKTESQSFRYDVQSAKSTDSIVPTVENVKPVKQYPAGSVGDILRKNRQRRTQAQVNAGHEVDRLARTASMSEVDYLAADKAAETFVARHGVGLDAPGKDDLRDRFIARVGMKRSEGVDLDLALNDARRNVGGDAGRLWRKQQDAGQIPLSAPVGENLTLGDTLADAARAPAHSWTELIHNESALDLEAADSLGAVRQSLAKALSPDDYRFVMKSVQGEKKSIRAQQLLKRADNILKTDGVIDHSGQLLKRTEATAGQAAGAAPEPGGFTRRQVAFADRAARQPGVKSALVDGDDVLVEFRNGWKARVSEGGLETGDLGSHQVKYPDGNGISVVKLRDLTNRETWTHELVHAGRETGVFRDAEWNALKARYGDDEEAIAEGLAQSMRGRGLMRRMKEFVARIWEAASGRTTATGTEGRWRRGEMFEREPTVGELLGGARYSHGKRVDNLGKLVELSQADRKANQGLWTELSPVSDNLAARIREASNGIIDPSGYSHVVDASAINHAIKSHGDIAELSRGQIPITNNDIVRIPEVLESADSIRHAGKTDAGLQIVEYVKNMGDGTTVYVEEVRVGRKKLAMKTLYKRKTSNNRDVQLYARDASRPEAGRSDAARLLDGNTESSIPPADGEVKYRREILAKSPLETLGGDPGRIQDIKQRKTTIPWREQFKNLMADDKATVSRVGKEFDRKRGVLDKSGDRAAVNGIARTSMEARLRTLVGQLNSAAETLRRGLVDVTNDKILKMGNLFDETLGLAELQARRMPGGMDLDARFQTIVDTAKQYGAAQNLVGLHSEAGQHMDAYLKALLKGEDASAGFLRARSILSGTDENVLRKLIEPQRMEYLASDSAQAIPFDGPDLSAAREFLSGKIDDWANRAAGLGIGKDGKRIKGDLDTAREIIALAEASADAETVKEMVANLRSWSNAMVEYVNSSGLLTKEQYAHLKGRGDFYITMQRVMDDSGNIGPSASADLIHTFQGSERGLINPFQSMPELVSRWKKKADINRYRAELASDTAALEGIGGRVLKEHAAGAIEFMDKGEKRWLQFDNPDIARAMAGFVDDPKLNEFLRYAGTVTGFTKRMITSDPLFMLRNKIRDTAGAVIDSQSGLTLREAMGLSGGTEEDMLRFVAYGADQAGWYGGAAKDIGLSTAEAMARLSKSPNVIVASLRGLKRGGQKLMALGDSAGARIERSTRMAEFKKAYVQTLRENPTLTHAEAWGIAARRARDVTLDFQIAGTLGRQLNMVIPFFNPAVQGLAKNIRLMRTNPKVFLKKMALYAGTTTAAAYGWNQMTGAGTEYAELPAWRRDYAWNLKIGDHWLVIPKPQGLAAVLSSGMERVMEQVHRGETDWSGYAWGVKDAASPADTSAIAGPLKGFVEVMANRDFFRDRDIVPSYEEELDPALRAGKDNASAIGRALARVFGKDGRQYDHVINSFTGGWGRAATDWTKTKDNRDWTRGLTGGLVRHGSPYEARSYWDAQHRAKSLGLAQSKDQRAFTAHIREGVESGQSVRELIAASRARRQQLEGITVADRLRQLETGRAKRQAKKERK